MNKFSSRLTALVLSRKNLLTEAGKYFIVGGVCTVLDFGLLYLLKEHFAIHFMTASVISFMSGTLLNYYLCTYWIFKVRRVTDRRMEMMFYIIITAIGLLLNSIVIWGLTSSFGYHFLVSKLAATFVTYWWNFGARKYFLHRSVVLQASN